jgi:glutamine phosphoribosylpyrophosphate amidotransferase
MLKSMPQKNPEKKFCTACFSGNYKINPPEGLNKKILEK